MGSRAEYLDMIIQKRLPFAQKIENVQSNLQALLGTITKFEQLKKVLLADAKSELYEQLSDINMTDVKSRISILLSETQKLYKRFSRETLNIGVVGRARQGKSTLLQSISGLTSSEIPSGDRLHCTGVKTSIHHRSHSAEEAEILFYTKDAFLHEVLYPYYLELKLLPTPQSIQEFSCRVLPNLPNEFVGNATAEAKYEHLKKYKNNVDSYIDLLGAEPLRIPISEVREYVAQDTIDGRRTYFKYLAVRDARISCRFPHDDIGKVALVDMPGLGDTGIGYEERLIKTLGEEVDIILFVKLPREFGESWNDFDLKLYDSVRNVLSSVPLDKWAFMVLNKTENNKKNCDDLVDTLDESHMKFIDMLLVNVRDQSEVRSKILDRVLEYLLSSIENIDRMYLAQTQNALDEIKSILNRELEKAKELLGDNNFTGSELLMFNKLFEEVYGDMANELEKLLRNALSYRDDINVRFEEALKGVLMRVRKETIPSVEEIEFKRNQTGSYVTAFNEFLHRKRVCLTRHFIDLDITLDAVIQEIREQVVNVFCGAGKLSGISTSSENDLLDFILQELPSKSDNLRAGFSFFNNFKISVRGFILHRLREHLDRLTPDKCEKYVQWDTEQLNAEEVQWWLEKQLDDTNRVVQETLYQWLKEPNQISFSLLEEFVDYILRAEGVKGEWQAFYVKFRGEIWKEQFAKLASQSKLHISWDQIIREVSHKSNSLFIL